MKPFEKSGKESGKLSDFRCIRIAKLKWNSGITTKEGLQKTFKGATNRHRL
jgi:hypothetical protein